MAYVFEWDPNKERVNRRKHRVSFDEAATVFADRLGITIDNPLHSIDEHRFIQMGCSSRDRLLVVVHTYCDNVIRIISARRATRKERHTYEETPA